MKHRELLEMEDLGITDEIRETAYKDQGEERGEEGSGRRAGAARAEGGLKDGHQTEGERKDLRRPDGDGARRGPAVRHGEDRPCLRDGKAGARRPAAAVG